MKFCSVALAGALLAGPLMAETVNRYAVAHTRHRDANMVIVNHPRFFDASLNQQERYTDIQSCVRSVKLAGTVVIVNDANNRFRYYGPKSAQLPEHDRHEVGQRARQQRDDLSPRAASGLALAGERQRSISRRRPSRAAWLTTAAWR